MFPWLYLLYAHSNFYRLLSELPDVRSAIIDAVVETYQADLEMSDQGPIPVLLSGGKPFSSSQLAVSK